MLNCVGAALKEESRKSAIPPENVGPQFPSSEADQESGLTMVDTVDSRTRWLTPGTHVSCVARIIDLTVLTILPTMGTRGAGQKSGALGNRTGGAAARIFLRVSEHFFLKEVTPDASRKIAAKIQGGG